MSAAPVRVRALFCPNCGAGVELRGFAHTLTAVCQRCLTVLDASTPSLKILQQIQENQRRNPLLPLGSRGKLRGVEWEIIGFQTRGTEDWEWAEYVLFNPYKGFRYLTEYRGHWNLVRPVHALPVEAGAGRRLDGATFKHFSSVAVITNFVLGEFPWRVRVGDSVSATDFIAPPLILSAETTQEEVTWSIGEYTESKEIWQAFGMKDAPPRPIGIFANQPSPFKGKVGGIWTQWMLWLGLLMVLAVIVSVLTAKREVFQQKYSYSPGAAGEASFVTPVFELKERTSTLEVNVKTDVSDNSIYLNFALINDATGEAFDFGREVSYYSGRDSDGSWTEGGKNDDVLIPSVPPGRYYLRVEPEMDPTNPRSSRGVNYELTLRRDVPSYSWFWIAGILLFLPPILVSFRAFNFERTRWAESDHPLVQSSSSSDDD